MAKYLINSTDIEIEEVSGTQNLKFNFASGNSMQQYLIPTGTLLDYAGSTAPTGFLICDGSAISRTTYADLFSVIGTTYGIGDGSTTFNLPDLQGKISVGLDSNDTDFDALGETGGSKTNKLELENYAYNVYNTTNDYEYNDISTNWTPSGNNYGLGSNYTTNHNTPVNNLQPYIVLNKIIKY